MSKVLVLAESGFEDSELLFPKYRLEELGFKVVIASGKLGELDGKVGYKVKVDAVYSNVHEADFQLLLLPGGKSPERARVHKEAVELVKSFAAMGKPIAAICHGPQLLISANVLKGKRATCYKGIKDDIILAGAIYEDKPVVVDGNLVTSRTPDDLPDFMREIVRLL